MKRAFFTFLALFPLVISGQFRSFFIAAELLEQKGLNAILERQFGKLPEAYEWRKTGQNSGAFTQQSFQLFYAGFPVQGQMVAVVVHRNKALVSATLNVSAHFVNPGVVAGHATWLEDTVSGNFHLYQYSDSAGQRNYKDASGRKPEFTEDMRRYAGKDTWTSGMIFLPDPLSRNNFIYGGNRRDRLDSNYSEIEAEQLMAKLECQFDNDSFRLENRWLKFAEVTPPLRAHAISTGNMVYTRNDTRFEEVNVFYHICELSKWWDTLGLGLFRDTVILDAHAYYGADESGFDPTVNPPTIEFGDGGVDDAEDADAPVHEYTHAAFNHVVPNSYFGTQRKAMEEGICDFMAVAYSNRYTPHQYGWVYNWDGHNEFWIGRDLNNDRVYPASLTNQQHIDGQLFGGAVFDLAAEIGFDSAVKIVMYTLPLMVPNISMRDGAQLLLQADSLFNDGRTRWPLIKALYPRGLLPNVGINSPEKETLLLRNSAAFAYGTGDLLVTSFCNGDLKLLDISGRTILQKQVSVNEEVHLSGNALPAGTYFLHCGARAYKVLKL